MESALPVTGQAASWGSQSRLSSELAMEGTLVRRGQGSVKTKAVSRVGRPPPGQMLTISEVWLTKFIEEKSE